MVSMKKVVLLVRDLHPNSVLIVDDYTRYFVYDRDCYVVYYLCGFSIKGCKEKFISDDISYLNYLVSKLKENHVDYMILVKRHGYNVEDSKQFLDNTYQKFYSKGKIVYKRQQEINYIKRKLSCKILEQEKKIKKVKEFIVRADV